MGTVGSVICIGPGCRNATWCYGSSIAPARSCSSIMLAIPSRSPIARRGRSPAYLFVAVLGASSYTYAEATQFRDLPNWIGSHVRAFQHFAGVPKLSSRTTGRPPLLAPVAMSRISIALTWPWHSTTTSL